ncbi:hypothetical protein Bbelb_247160 [Branchiostoma belcheri]|nr:hypothetical protein Bbelb_247160 [Branchiostoma belcheri]
MGDRQEHSQRPRMCFSIFLSYQRITNFKDWEHSDRLSQPDNGNGRQAEAFTESWDVFAPFSVVAAFHQLACGYLRDFRCDCYQCKSSSLSSKDCEDSDRLSAV